MAVYVDLTHDDIAAFIAPYNIGECVSFKSIAQGVSNTNYHVFTTQGRYILTLLEPRRTNADDLPFIFAWADHLNNNGIHCPTVLRDENGISCHTLKNRAAFIVNFLEGGDISRGQTSIEHCQKMGVFTAKLHITSKNFIQKRPDTWSLERFNNILSTHFDAIKSYDLNLNALIADEIAFQQANALGNFARGVVHTDLFPDNIFFDDHDQITAVIDLYFACTRSYLYDLAIVVNAWCFDQNGNFNTQKFVSLLTSYETMRPLTPIERSAFQTMLRLASLRFLMSRLEEWVTFDPQCTVMTPHDPRQFIDRLAFHQKHDIIAA